MNKKLLVAVAVAAVAASSSSFAAVNKQGFYVGAQAGASRADYGSSFKNAADLEKVDHKEGGFGWAALAGYNFNQNFGVEGSFLSLAKNTYGDKDEVTLKTSSWNLMAKAGMPISDSNFDVYAKAGAAYVERKLEILDDSRSDHKVRPVAAIGTGYTFNNGVGLDLSWTHIFGSSDDNNLRQYANGDMVALGLTYNFQQWA